MPALVGKKMFFLKFSICEKKNETSKANLDFFHFCVSWLSVTVIKSSKPNFGRINSFVSLQFAPIKRKLGVGF